MCDLFLEKSAKTEVASEPQLYHRTARLDKADSTDAKAVGTSSEAEQLYTLASRAYSESNHDSNLLLS